MNPRAPMLDLVKQSLRGAFWVFAYGVVIAPKPGAGVLGRGGLHATEFCCNCRPPRPLMLQFTGYSYKLQAAGSGSSIQVPTTCKRVPGTTTGLAFFDMDPQPLGPPAPTYYYAVLSLQLPPTSFIPLRL